MASSEPEAKIIFAICIGVVLMRHGNTNYNLVQAKIQSYYHGGIYECLDHPEYLRKVLKEVYKEEYSSILEHIRLESDHLVDKDDFKAVFFKIMIG